MNLDEYMRLCYPRASDLNESELEQLRRMSVAERFQIMDDLGHQVQRALAALTPEDRRLALAYENEPWHPPTTPTTEPSS